MNQIDFLPIGRKVSQIGLGCGRLVGRSTLIQSARIVETALDLGIRYFDVAPSYGMGTAEEVLGHVTGDSKEVVIATKVGIPRPHYSARNNFLSSSSFQNLTGIDGKGFLQTNSPFVFFMEKPFSSNISTSIPNPLF